MTTEERLNRICARWDDYIGATYRDGKALIGKSPPRSPRARSGRGGLREVIGTDPAGVERQFGSLTEAGKAVGASAQSVYCAARNADKGATAGGWKWRCVEQSANRRAGLAVVATYPDGRRERYESLVIAACAANISIPSIHKYIKSGRAGKDGVLWQTA